MVCALYPFVKDSTKKNLIMKLIKYPPRNIRSALDYSLNT